ncbi:MAG: tyrosine--tRNA ligase [Spirochaetaceae bacterium]|nr:MAG: tyrosine--tRNA ligase [Spirochaetaceae bacterium]
MDRIEQEVERQVAEIAGRADRIIPEDELRAKLRVAVAQGRPLRVKYGIDPTTPDVHIGHLVPCRVIRAFQDSGHTAVIIIGDYTARIGDPSGRNAERPPLSEADVARNMEHYAEQLFRVVDPDRAEVHRQSAWFGSMGLDQTLRLAARFSVAQMMAHETFRARLDSGNRLSIHELLYPALQAYDSVQIGADVEIGGSDQLFNCLCGRDLQRSHGVDAQVVVTVPLMRGTDGRKMSKSFGNHIPVDLPAPDVVGRTMSMPDNQIEELIALTTDWSAERRADTIARLRAEDASPRDLKLDIARSVATQLHGADAAAAAIDEFERVVSRGERPSEVARYTVRAATAGVDPGPGPSIVDLLIECRLASSRSDARRLVEQRGVRVDGTVVESIDERVTLECDHPRLLQAGRRRFVEVVRSA